MPPPGVLTWIRDNSVPHVYLPAIFENACLLSIARWSVGNLTNRPANAVIMRDSVRMQRPAVDLDILPRLQSTNGWLPSPKNGDKPTLAAVPAKDYCGICPLPGRRKLGVRIRLYQAENGIYCIPHLRISILVD